MIIIGYQGIGKSTLAGKRNCIDLESGNFWVDGKRDEKWYIPYCQIAKHLSKQGYTVFVSSHKVVQEELKNSREKVYVICPSSDLKDKWIDKLRTRWEATGLNKDYKAYINAVDRYSENIQELMNSGFTAAVIDNMNYSINSILTNLSMPFPEVFTWSYTGAHLVKGE